MAAFARPSSFLTPEMMRFVVAAALACAAGALVTPFPAPAQTPAQRAFPEVAAYDAPPAARRSATARARVRCLDGSAGAFPCRNVDLLAHLPVAALGGGSGARLNDLWGWTDPATGREYALVGRSDGTAFVDVTDPENPFLVGSLRRTTGARASGWRDVKTYANHAFVVADVAGSHGLQVFDLRGLRDATGPPVTFEPTATYERFGNAHNLAIDEETGFGYAVGTSFGEACGGGVHMVDLRDPTAPTFAGCYAGAGYVHDAQCVVYAGPDADYAGREICVLSAGDRLAAVDVTDKGAPVPLFSTGYPGLGYVHQGWFTEDHRYFLQNDETDEIQGTAARTRTLIWDLADLDAPVFMEPYYGPTTATDHNLYVRGDYAYEANYKSGLRIVDFSDPTRPFEAGFFDTVPGSDAPGTEGAWSVYPFFESGTVVVSSIAEGLFVLEPRELGPAASLALSAAAEGDVVAFSWRWTEAGESPSFQIEEYTAGRPGFPTWMPVQAEPAPGDPDVGLLALRLEGVFPGEHRYRLRVVHADGFERVSEPIVVRVELRGPYARTRPYPNPARDRFAVTVAVRREQRVRVELFDVGGRRVALLFDGVLAGGEARHLAFELPAALGSGLYLYRVTADDFVDAHPVTIVR